MGHTLVLINLAQINSWSMSNKRKLVIDNERIHENIIMKEKI